MARGPVHLASDVHLGAVPRETEIAFVRWLEHSGERADEVVVNGDLFDFWFEYRHAVPRGHTRVLGALAALVDAGVPVRLMGGNHDWWGGSFLEDEIGVTFHRDPVVLDLAGHRTFLAHGDALGQGDLGYRMLRLVLRGRLTRWAFRWLHPDVGAGIARRVSHTEITAADPTRRDQARSEVLEDWGVAKLEAEPDLDLVVLGHTHVPRLRQVGPGRWYVNSGDWVYHRSYLVLSEGEPPRLSEWEESGR
ncbi:MAG: UDP-2,3-diacylglucosamine diphosphatase [Gemmatimonadota bacterium]|jgi:UDP-2,3-diacylglucosamine hydrolase